MDVTVTLTDRTQRYAASLTPALSAAVRAATFGIEARAKVNIQTGPKSGRKYRRGKKWHRASAKGEAPATDSGTLVNSIRGRMDSPLEGSVTVGAAYGARLENGLDRPFLSPALEAVKPAFEAAIAAVLAGGEARR